jgi:hypothetical protein
MIDGEKQEQQSVVVRQAEACGKARSQGKSPNEKDEAGGKDQSREAPSA